MVDDGSADPGAEPLRRTSRPVRHATARGPAAARNAGLRAAAHAAVAFLDSDCVPRPGWLAVLPRTWPTPGSPLVAPRIVALPAEAGLGRGYEVASGRAGHGRRSPHRSPR